MADDDAARWDARWADAGPAVPSPPAALSAARLVDLVPNRGRALDVACGTGAQTVWLAERGLEVEALDVSPVAVRSVSTRAHETGLGDLITARVCDLDLDRDPDPDPDPDPDRDRDLDRGLAAAIGPFDVIVCQRFRAPHLYPAFTDLLARGGLAVVTVLSRTGASSPGPFHAEPGELATAFDRPGVELLFHSEADGEESIVVRRVG